MLREIPPTLSRIKSFTKPRSMHAIMAGLLQVCEQKTKRTHVIYKVNLSHALLLEYVELALANGLVEEMSDRSLLTTEKGRIYLEHFSFIERMLGRSIDHDSDNETHENDTYYRDRKIFLPMTI